MSFDFRPVRTASRSSCFGRLAVSFHFAAADSALHGLDRLEFLLVTTARKLPSRTTLTKPGIFFDR